MPKDKVRTYKFAIIALSVISVLVFAIAVCPAGAQNPVPVSARQAAQMPEYASRLAHNPTSHPAKAPGPPGTRSHPNEPQAGIIYENGPVNGTTDAWAVNFGYIVADSFPSLSTISGFDFYAWMFPGDKALTVDWSITSSPFGGVTYSSGTASVTDSFLSVNQYGYEIHKLTVSGINGAAGSGTNWFNLQNATTMQGNPLYWDENSGTGCNSPGCPSAAEESALGTIPSEAFDLQGDNACYSDAPGPGENQPAQAQSFNVIYNFTGGADGASPLGLTRDRAGNLYGVTAQGGNMGGSCSNYGCGVAFELINRGGGWVLNVLHSFTGNVNGDGETPSSRIVFGPDGSLYGVTGAGGNDGCYDYGCGTVFNLKPPATACRSALCEWVETVVYRFLGPASDHPAAGSCSVLQSLGQRWQRLPLGPLDGGDGMDPVGDPAFDRAGSLYGTARIGPEWWGGCGCGVSCGLVYKLTPSSGGWNETILYSFQGMDDGGSPLSGVILDADGNYYLTTTYSNMGSGTVWARSQQVHQFAKDGWDGARPAGGLIFDPAGNLFGTTARGGNGCGGCGCGTAFKIAYPYQPGDFQQLYSFRGVGSQFGWAGPQSSLVMDAAGNLYGTTTADGAYQRGSAFKLTPGTGGWTYTNLYDFTGGADGGGPSGLTLDGNGNLWGATSYGGTYGKGVIFEITP